MTTLQSTLARRTPTRAGKAVSAEQVREMLREIAFVLHATRVVGRRRTEKPERLRAGGSAASAAQ